MSLMLLLVRVTRAQRTFHDMLPKLPAGIAFEVDLYTKRDLFLKVPPTTHARAASQPHHCPPCWSQLVAGALHEIAERLPAGTLFSTHERAADHRPGPEGLHRGYECAP
jgi:hypothetical protein